MNIEDLEFLAMHDGNLDNPAPVPQKAAPETGVDFENHGFTFSDKEVGTMIDSGTLSAGHASVSPAPHTVNGVDYINGSLGLLPGKEGVVGQKIVFENTPIRSSKGGENKSPRSYDGPQNLL